MIFYEKNSRQKHNFYRDSSDAKPDHRQLYRRDKTDPGISKRWRDSICFHSGYTRIVKKGS